MKNTILYIPLFFLFVGKNYCKAENKNPNFLLILVDDLGYGDLSCQGATDLHTPNIDSLFNMGIKFTNFYSNSTVSSPTRASLMTGRYPDLVGVPGVIRTHEENNWGYFSPNTVTLPEILKKSGYKTAMIGKWHLGLESPNLPNERGFDFFHGFLGDMMDDYWTHLRHDTNYMRLNKKVINPKGHATDIFTDWTIEYINKSKKNQPFFLYLAYNAPHFPIQPPEEWIDRVKAREKNATEKRVQNIALIEHLDANIGRLIETLNKNKLMENTIVVFVSDNGGHLPSGASNGKLRGGKQDMFEGGIKVPACMVWKNKISPRSQTNVLSATMDVFPTFGQISNAKISHKIDGMSLFPFLFTGVETEENNSEREIFFMRREGGEYGGLCYYAVRKGEYKLLQNKPFENFELYNVNKDPYEKEKIANMPEKYKELKSLLTRHIQKSGSVPWQK
ncbi:MAG: sulfatase-like hydrolase/transferase [Parabacteroides sp.]|nr:sulfatase-like hydrolase/transferase [Parabacteroides sp.]